MLGIFNEDFNVVLWSRNLPHLPSRRMSMWLQRNPFSPTSIRAPLGASPFPHPQPGDGGTTTVLMHCTEGNSRSTSVSSVQAKLIFLLTLEHFVALN